MSEKEIRFDDGAAYEQFMGVWSRLVGEVFLDWLQPAPRLAWLDVGCGNGAFSELLVERTQAASVLGIDPSEAQLDFARKRHKAGIAKFEKGGAEALPVKDASFDAAVMALVIFFVKNPAKGVAEMVRATKAGGSVSTYGWDLMGGGFPLFVIGQQLEEMGVEPVLPPSPEAAGLDALLEVWRGAGLQDISTRVIAVERSFANLDELWAINMAGPRLSTVLAELAPQQRIELRQRVQERLPPRADGRIVCEARANAVKGRVPT